MNARRAWAQQLIIRIFVEESDAPQFSHRMYPPPTHFTFILNSLFYLKLFNCFVLEGTGGGGADESLTRQGGGSYKWPPLPPHRTP